MKTKRIIKFLSLMMATVILLLSFSVSISAQEDAATENGSYDENQDTNVSDQEPPHENEVMPFWPFIILVILSLPSILFNHINEIIPINDILNDIVSFFVNIWTSIFG